VPASLVASMVREKHLVSPGTPALDQLTLAALMESGRRGARTSGPGTGFGNVNETRIRRGVAALGRVLAEID
jgi:hypothetical protein